jgi:hypothetical protein
MWMSYSKKELPLTYSTLAPIKAEKNLNVSSVYYLNVFIHKDMAMRASSK